jgi:lipoate-protein ligase A
MKWFDFTFATPAENLACDEALLDLCERDGVEVLRFWESLEPFVVVGYGNRVESEVNVEECRRRGAPILRRCSGGGTVVQGPGCLNYNLTLKIPEKGPLTTVTGTNKFVMEQNRTALEKLLGMNVFVQGHTDLAFSPRNPNLPRNRNPPTGENKIKNTITITKSELFKFSGNAQRRRRRALVFHGTILHGFDLSLIDALLRFPSAQPDYRARRSHSEFVRNVPASADAIRDGLREAWGTEATATAIPSMNIENLVREQYANPDWTFRR